MCVSQSTPIAKATAIPRLTCLKLYTTDEVLQKVVNGSDIELDYCSDEDTDGSFDNEKDYQLSLDVQGENDFESPSSAGDELEVSSHSTVPLDPKKCKNCYLTQKGIWSTGCLMAPRYEQRRYLSFRTYQKRIRIVPEILYRWIVWIVSRAK